MEEAPSSRTTRASSKSFWRAASIAALSSSMTFWMAASIAALASSMTF